MLLLNPLLFAGLLALPPPLTVPAEKPLRTDQVTAHSGMQTLMQALESEPALHLVIGHAGGETGTARAEALRATLVALGLGSARITLAPQPLDEPVLILSLEKSAK